jgi:hypothetical protein
MLAGQKRSDRHDTFPFNRVDVSRYASDGSGPLRAFTRPNAIVSYSADSEGRPERALLVLFHFVRDYPGFPGYYPRLHRSLYINRLTHLYVILVF